ncbi:MAG TPA: efflux transporter outer membrane subunit [Albitalea sp.]|nr:efflux transporter outer membrane subunit [Albitalea sp.]
MSECALSPFGLSLSKPLLAAALLLSGCMSLAPQYERPAAPVAGSFAANMAGDGPAASDIAWQDFFKDERLKRLVGIALQNNRDLRIAVLNIEQARATWQVRRADELPTVGVGATATRQPGTTGGISSVYTVGLAVTSYELDLFGRVRNLSEAALAQYLGTEEGRKAAQMSLVAAVATNYLSLLADDDLLAVTRATLATREESFKLTKLKFDNGAASELDFRQAESLLEGARVTLAQLTRQRMLDENALALLLGQPVPADLPSGLPLTGQQVLAELPAGLPSELLTRRPDVRAAEQQLIAANANIGAARAAFFPRITLTGSVGSASTALSGLFKSGSFAWTFAPQALLPIFDAGRNQANLDLARVNRDIAVAQYERAIQTAFREVADALAGRATLGDQLRAQLAQLHAEEVRFRLADLRYRNGVASYLDVLDAQRALFLAQQATVQTQALQAQNLVIVYKTLGGGWSEAAPVR